jgi:hypothetical protein
MNDKTYLLKTRPESANNRLGQAIDILIDYIMQLNGNNLWNIREPDDQEAGSLLIEGGSRSESKSERRSLLPPPVLSS